VNENEHRALQARFGEIIQSRDYGRLDEVYTPDVIVEFPQSGERFRGIESVRGQFANYPGLDEAHTEMADVIGGTAYALTTMYTVVAVEGSGDRGTALFRTRYPDGTYWWLIHLYELEGGRIARVRTLFAPEFEAPAWREPFWDKG
jgi:hypothetical protein